MAKTLDDFNNDIANAASALKIATTNAQNALTSLNRCNCGKGKFPFGGDCAPLKHAVSFGSMASISECIDAPNINKCETDCCSKSTCISHVNNYNTLLGTYNTAVTNLATANQAKADAIKNDPTLAAQANSIIDAAKSAASKTYTRNAIIIIIVIAAVIIIGFLIRRKSA